VVEDVWDLYDFGDDDEPTGGGIEDLIAEQASADAEADRMRATFAHAMARSRLHADPLTALVQVLINGARADPDGKADRRDRVHAYLSGFATRGA
jgi:hypothetical protein